jgi:CRP/FNR family cyclic AMP-dependent transcriptional regulator
MPARTEAELQRALARSALFEDLDAAALRDLAALARRRHYPAGAPICIEGESDGSLFIIATGRVRISAGSSDGDERHLNELGPGDLIGEIALLDGASRSASAIAVDDSQVYGIERAAFVAFLDRTPELARSLIKLLCQRVRWMTGLLEASAFLGLPARLARWLIMLAAQQGVAHPRGVEVRVSQQDLAQFLGVSRQSVNEVLQAWRGDGLVDLGRGRIVVLDDLRLRGEAARAATATDA